MASKSLCDEYDEPDILQSERKVVLGRAISTLIRTRRKVYPESMTQEELAFRSGISYEHLNRIENSKAMASVEVLDRIARAFGFHRLSDFLACDESETL